MTDKWPHCPDFHRPLLAQQTQYVCVDCGQRWEHLDDPDYDIQPLTTYSPTTVGDER